MKPVRLIVTLSALVLSASGAYAQGGQDFSKAEIIPGHGPTVDRSAVMAHRGIAIAIRDRVAALLAQGKSEDEVEAAKVTADLDGKIQRPGTTGERFVRQAYADLKATR